MDATNLLTSNRIAKSTEAKSGKEQDSAIIMHTSWKIAQPRVTVSSKSNYQCFFNSFFQINIYMSGLFQPKINIYAFDRLVVLLNFDYILSTNMAL